MYYKYVNNVCIKICEFCIYKKYVNTVCIKKSKYMLKIYKYVCIVKMCKYV